MSNTKQILRLNGYSANDEWIICDSGVERFKHERTGLLRIVVSRDTKEARALMDAVIDAIDEPRALVGRDRHGVVMIFKVEHDFSNTSESIALRSGEELVISLASVGEMIDPGAFSWIKNRTPLDISRDALPPLRAEFAKIASEAAWNAGARSSDELAREHQSDRYRADLASGKIKVRTAEEQQAREDAAIVAANAGIEFIWTDGHAAQLVLDARIRHEARQRKQNAAA